MTPNTNTSSKAVSDEVEAVKQGLRRSVEIHRRLANWHALNNNKNMVAQNNADAKLYEDSISLIDRMSQRIAELEGMVPRWIAVSDQKPKRGATVLVYCPRGMYEKVYSAGFDQVFHTGEDVVTHWMPLPQPKE